MEWKKVRIIVASFLVFPLLKLTIPTMQKGYIYIYIFLNWYFFFERKKKWNFLNNNIYKYWSFVIRQAYFINNLPIYFNQ